MDQTVARTVEQNARLHAMVRDIARHVIWAGARMNEEAWKRVFLAAKYGQKIVPNPFTGIGMVVVNDRRSRDLSVEEMSEFLMEIEAFGASQNVDWSEDE